MGSLPNRQQDQLRGGQLHIALGKLSKFVGGYRSTVGGTVVDCGPGN